MEWGKKKKFLLFLASLIDIGAKCNKEVCGAPHFSFFLSVPQILSQILASILRCISGLLGVFQRVYNQSTLEYALFGRRTRPSQVNFHGVARCSRAALPLPIVGRGRSSIEPRQWPLFHPTGSVLRSAGKNEGQCTVRDPRYNLD